MSLKNKTIVLGFTAALFLSCTDTSPLKFPSEDEVREMARNSSSSGVNLRPSSSSRATPGSPNENSCINGAFTDIRDGKSYNCVVIDTKFWMAENLNFEVNGSKCYYDSPEYCVTYGRLYDWTTAMSLPSTCGSIPCTNQIKSNHQGICPSGWHIPKEEEFNEIKTKKLGAKDGFAALLGGKWSNNFTEMSQSGYWWSASETSSTEVNFLSFDKLEKVSITNGLKTNMFSVRCVKD